MSRWYVRWNFVFVQILVTRQTGMCCPCRKARKFLIAFCPKDERESISGRTSFNLIKYNNSRQAFENSCYIRNRNKRTENGHRERYAQFTSQTGPTTHVPLWKFRLKRQPTPVDSEAPALGHTSSTATTL